MRIIIKALFILTIISIVESCSFFSLNDRISILWPSSEMMGAMEPDFWDVSWLSDGGTVAHKQVPGGGLPVLCIPRESPIIITAVPVVSGITAPFQFRPAAYVAAADTPRPTEAVLTWEEGFAAAFLLNLAGSGIPPERVNINRFVETVNARSHGNPWLIDYRRLSSDFLKGDLWVYSFRLLPSVTVSLTMPIGSWYSEYPLEPVMVSDAGHWFGELTIGLHHFIRLSDGTVSSVSVDERGDVIIYSGSCQFTGEICRSSSH